MICFFGIIATALRIASLALIIGAVCATSTSAAQDISPNDINYTNLAFEALDAKKGTAARKHIVKISDPLLRKTMLWFLYTQSPIRISWSTMAQFIDENPHWPKLRTIRKNIEQAMDTATPPARLGAWFSKWPPVTARGNGLFAGKLLSEGMADEAVKVIKNTWINGDFTRADEKWFYKSYRKHLSRTDHAERLDRLLWDGGNWSVRRMFPRVDDDLRRLAEARYLLRHQRGNVDAAIARVPSQYLNHVGLIYERLQWRRRKGKDKSARSLLEDALGDVPHPDLWFREREILARRALSQGLISVAYDLVREHGVPRTYAKAYSSAEWLSGWIALRFLNEPEWALQHFEAMRDVVRFPISVARASYWAGRATSALKQPDIAADWYSKAMAYPTTYYGQLAAAQLPDAPFAPRLNEYLGDGVGPQLELNELVQVIRLLNALGARDRLRPFLQHLIDTNSNDIDWLVAIGRLAQEVGRSDFGVRVAKSVVRDGIILPELGYPIIDLPMQPTLSDAPMPEEALVFSLIRQESSYYSAAKSSTGARGLMQLMPATAKSTAKIAGLPYSRVQLTTRSDYNLTLGQAYLSSVLDRFDGSYVLALAAYNAGPSRAKAWVKNNGDPRDSDIDAVDWVELIPFNETRNYVQRVMEALQVYRTRIDASLQVSQLAQDLVR